MAKDLEQMKKNYEKAVMDYVAVFLEQFGLNREDCWWVGNRVGLDLFCFGDCWSITFENIVYVVENGVTFDEYLGNLEYNEKCSEYGLPHMNLKSWHEGAPLHDFTKLDALKKDLEEAIKNEREKF